MRKSSRKSATFTRKNQDQGSIFSHEIRFAKQLASFTTISKSPILIRPFISLHKNGEGLFTVVLVLEAMLASSTGKFET